MNNRKSVTRTKEFTTLKIEKEKISGVLDP